MEPDEPQGEWVSDSRWGTPNTGGHNWKVGDSAELAGSIKFSSVKDVVMEGVTILVANIRLKSSSMMALYRCI